MFWRHARACRRHALAAAVTVAVTAGLLFATAASAATLTVTNNSDNAAGSLRALINSASAGDTIDIPASVGTITLDTPITIDVNLTINGAGAGSTTISGGSATQLLQISGVNVALSGITLEDGVAPAGGTNPGSGGAIESGLDSYVTVSDCVFTGNTADGGVPSGSPTSGGSGGAIYSDGVLDISNTSFTNNTAAAGSSGGVGSGGSGDGGAIFNDDDGVLAINGGSFEHNIAQAGTGAGSSAGGGGEGGAIFNGQGVVGITGTSFGATSGNQAQASLNEGTNGGQGGLGGAIVNSAGELTLSADTFDDNTANGAQSGSTNSGGGGQGGAVFGDNGVVQVFGGSFSANEVQGSVSGGGAAAGNGGDGGALYMENGTLAISAGTTLSDNTAGGGAAGTSNSGGGGAGGAIYAGQLTLSSVTLTSNAADVGADEGATPGNPGEGGAVEVTGSLDATNATFTNNGLTASALSGARGGSGGALAFDGAESGTVDASSFSGNTVAGGTEASHGGNGGALYFNSSGLLTLDADGFTGNQATNGLGGAIFAENGTLSLSDSTLSGNTAELGGAVDADNNAMVDIADSTIDGNTADTTPLGEAEGDGGGVRVVDELRLASDTIVDNSAYGNGPTSTVGGNLDEVGGANGLFIHDTLIADGQILGSGFSGSENCEMGDPGVIFDLGYNAEDNQADGNECDLSSADGDLVDAASLDGDLGSLASNGGPTQTVALLAGSPAIDAGDPAGCTDNFGKVLSADQRGTARPQGPRCDIGAYEYVHPVAPTPTPTPPGPVAPVLSGLGLSPQVFVTLAGGGSSILYSDSEAGVTTFTVTGTVRGYRPKKRKHKGSSCKALPASGKLPKHSSKCTISGTFGSFSHQDVAGANTVTFSGQLNGKALAKGSYTLSAKPVYAGLTGAIETTTFKIAS